MTTNTTVSDTPTAFVIVRSLVMVAIWTFKNHMNTGLIYNSSR